MQELSTNFINDIKELIHKAQSRTKTSINLIMVYTYYEIGRRIVEEEQHGEERAKYGQYILRQLSNNLTNEFGKGFSITNLKLMRQFYIVYSADTIGQTLSDQFVDSNNQRQFYLSWSHYLKLLRIRNADERRFYEIEAVKNNWSLSELKRQCDSALYERLSLSADKEKVSELSKVGQIIAKPSDIIKDPYVLDFLGLEELPSYSESELESRIISNLEKFLLELGRGFLYAGRQVRITLDEDHYWIDLVFYNRILKCFVLFDLKIGELKHQDIGQMQMYVNYYDRNEKTDDENPTIGVILCKDKKDALVEMTLPKDNNQIFASKYETVLPTKESLIKLMTEQ